jgi:hypothetical protein
LTDRLLLDVDAFYLDHRRCGMIAIGTFLPAKLVQRRYRFVQSAA